MLPTVPLLPPRCCWIARDAVPPLLPAHPSCSVAIDQLCVHECHVVGKGGQYWPQPTFKVRWLGGGGAAGAGQEGGHLGCCCSVQPGRPWQQRAAMQSRVELGGTAQQVRLLSYLLPFSCRWWPLIDPTSR